MPALLQQTRGAVRVGVCVPTFKRPYLLRQLLEGLAVLTFHRAPQPEIVVIVVDNDAERSAEEVCRSVAVPWEMKYVAEPRRGIAQARNRAVRAAADADFIAFIDDDEIPAPGWLDELLSTQAAYAADVVCGPVVPRYAAGVPEWVKTGGFFDRPIPAAGETPDVCRTGNVLIRGGVFAYVEPFDERFGLTGGEDTEFFFRVRAAGFAIVSSDSAVVHEVVPPSRANLPWVLRRAYQSGNSWVLCESSRDGRLSTRIIRAGKACGRIAQGALFACVSPLFGWAAFARALKNLCLGAGMLAALAGQKYQAYQSAGANPAQS
ncbi:MAG TPA: glycosyltransferase [Candidatus Acidoferrales bacterium]|nr:glycosyltransferase [Candidatus Acidoferrales bacterium]